MNKGHGRLEIRRCWAIGDPAYLAYVDPERAWPGLKSLALVEAERRVGGEVTIERRYYLSSLPADAAALNQAVRAHWGIENRLHWVLDVAFREDHSRARTGHAPANLAVLRHLALNLLRRDPARGSIAKKRFRAALDTDCGLGSHPRVRVPYRRPSMATVVMTGTSRRPGLVSGHRVWPAGAAPMDGARHSKGSTAMEGQRPPVFATNRATRVPPHRRAGGRRRAGAAAARGLLQHPGDAGAAARPRRPSRPSCEARRGREASRRRAGPELRASPSDIKLTAWFTDRRSINDMTEKEAMPEFQAKNPGINVEVQFVPEAQIQQKLLAAKAANNAPDLTAIDETFEDTLWKNKALVPIPPSVMDVRKEMGAKVADLYKLPPGQAQGEYFGLPNGTFGGVLYYNEDLLNELKYTPEQIPTKWDDFFKWAKDITMWNGNTLERTGFTIFGTEDGLRHEYRVQQGGWQDGNLFPTKEKVALARDLEYEAIKFVLDIYDVHKLDARDGVTYQEKFGTGKAVTAFAWTWNNGFFETQFKMQNYGTKLTPHVDPSKKDWPHGLAGPDVGFCVTTQSTNQAQVDATWKLWRYLVGPEYLKRYCDPARRPAEPEVDVDRPGVLGGQERREVGAAGRQDEAGPEHGLRLQRDRAEHDPGAGDAADPRREGRPEDGPAGAREGGQRLPEANPQWSILSAADYKAHPEWLKPEG